MLLLQQGQKREGLGPSEKAQIFRNPRVLDRKEVFFYIFFKRLTTLSAALCSVE
jgi:hypothetical protein